MALASCMPLSRRVRSKSSTDPSAGWALPWRSKNRRFMTRQALRIPHKAYVLDLAPATAREKEPARTRRYGDEQEARQMAQAHPGGAGRAGAHAFPGNQRAADLHRRLCL